jgi:hypothetical protein
MILEIKEDELQDVAKVIEAGLAHVILNGIFIDPKAMDMLTELCVTAKHERMEA